MFHFTGRAVVPAAAARSKRDPVGPGRRLGPALIALLVAVVAGCSTGGATWAPLSSPAGATSGSTSGYSGPAPTPAITGDDALLTYGYAPSPNPSVKLQPDVVIVGGGASSIRWASADGHTWAIDPAAPRASDLAVGSVMFLTSRAVGRVAEIRDEGGNRVVSLAPVQLNEIFSDADFHLDQALDPGAVYYQQLPELPGTVTDLSASPSPGASDGLGRAGGSSTDGTITAPAIRLLAAQVPPAGSGSGAAYDTTATQLPPVVKVCHEFTLDKTWSIKPCVESQKIALGIDYKTASGGVAGGGLKFGGILTLKFNDLHTSGDVSIQGGSISKATVLLDGITGFGISLGAGVADGVKDDVKFKFEVPVEVETPIPPSPATLGVPLNLVLEFKTIVEVAFSGRNSTMTGDGEYGVDGPLGVQDGNLVAPSVTVIQSLANSLSGIAIGPSGVVLAGKFKMQLGLGMDGFVAGPYAVTTLSVGASMGSALGSPIANCVGASVNMWVGGGVGATVDFSKFKTFLPDALTKFKNEVEKTWSVYSVNTTIPDVPICKTS